MKFNNAVADVEHDLEAVCKKLKALRAGHGNNALIGHWEGIERELKISLNYYKKQEERG